MTDWLHPSLVLLLGAAALPLLPAAARRIWLVLVPLFGLAAVFSLSPGTHGQFEFLGMRLITGRVDELSLVFAYVFGIILVIGMIFALHLRDTVQHVAALTYAAAALGAVLAGDLVTLYVFWELMVITSVWLIWRRGTDVSYASGMRYLIIHAIGGVLLLAGVVVYYQTTGSIAFDQIETGSPAFYLILVAFMINAAVPPLHAWLSDAYPEATVTGAVFMSALTTKTAVYVLMRGYPGLELLMWMGAIMTWYGVVFAVLANDIRRILAYHIISQVGYMVCAVGMGTSLALSGAAAHAFTHILYKALLFMGAGAVIYMTGKSKLTELGGLYRSMPWTFVLFMVGAVSISGFPLFSGFVSKTIIIEAAAVEYHGVIYLMLLTAGAGTFLSIGLKLAWFTFLGRDAGLRPKEAPANMLIAMALAAAACFLIGVMPGPLYSILPAAIDYNAWTLGHVLKEMQLLLFTGLAFFLLLRFVGGKNKIALDVDWIYRGGGRALAATVRDRVSYTNSALRGVFMDSLVAWMARVKRRHGRDGKLARSWPTGSMAFWVVVLLASLLIFGIRQP
ncbi:MAG: Na(+)/H(+) antiporter subunit D [Wenzhouxiangella sp.]|jgi:multicomponent Na+:H+ antiporter subunit D|nr:Na(+)/H(+) antiporter subunit D [Wenzhouxiangella sp.]